MIPWFACLLLALAPPELADPGFEGDAGAWRFGGQGGVRREAAAAHGGEAFARVRFDDRAAQAFAARAGNWYAVAGFCRAETATAEVPRIKTYYLDAAGRRISTGGEELPGVTADRWQPFTVTFAAPPGTATVSIDLIGQFGGAAWFWFDDLSLTVIGATDWPDPAALPELQHRTVLVPDRADVHSYALYRLPPNSRAPIDGVVGTAAWTRRAAEIAAVPPEVDFTIDLARPAQLHWVLLHASSPTRPFRRGAITIGGQTVPLTAVGPGVVSCLLPQPARASQLVLAVRHEGDETVEIHELQCFGLASGTDLPGGLEYGHWAVASDVETAYAAQRAGAGAPLVRGLSRTTAAAESLALPAGQPALFHVRLAEETGVRAVKLAIDPGPLAESSLLEVAVLENAALDIDPHWADRFDRKLPEADQLRRRRGADLVRIPFVVPAGRAEPVDLAIDLPDTIFDAGEGLWVELRANAALTLRPDSVRVTVATCAPADATAEYLPRLERCVRGLYTIATEAHIYDSRDVDYRGMLLNEYVERLLRLAPDNDAAQRIQGRIAKRLERVDPPRPGPADAPDWAVWGRAAQRQWVAMVDWWLDHRWVSSGEIGGNLNDDVEYSCHWPLAYLITGDHRFANAQRAIADAVWEQSGETGYSIRARDVEHAGEDSGCSLPQMLVCEYGRPVHVERMMTMSRLIPRWTAINGVGRRQFRSYMFNADWIDDGPRKDVDHLYCALAMIGTAHLAWYSGHPQARQWLDEYARAWAAAGLSTDQGKPRGKLPCDIRFGDSRIAPYTDRWDRSVYYSFGAYVMEYLLLGAHRLGLGGADVAAMQPYLTVASGKAVSETRARLAEFADRPSAEHFGRWAADGTWRPSTSGELAAYEAFRATGDLQLLGDWLHETCREFERSRWLLTEAEPYTDRIPVPGTTLLRHMFLGGDVAGKTHVPGLAVSWSGGGTDYAACVQDATDTSLRVLLYGFHERTTPMQMRVWRLQPGTYTVTIGDETRTGVPLRRYAAVPFNLPPGRELSLTITLEQAEPATGPLPDLAIGPEDVTRDERGFKVTVHNLGAADAPGGLVRFLDLGGRTVTALPVPPIPAPLDLLPKTVTIDMGDPGRAWATVELVPAGPDLEAINNRLP